MNSIKPVCLAALAVAATSAVSFHAEAAPLPTHVGAMKAALDSPIAQVRYGRWHGGCGGGYRGRGYRGWGYRGWGYRGWGASAVVGAAIATSAYYGGYPYYGGGFPYYGGGYAYSGSYASEYCPPYEGYYRNYYGW